mmetsp:Transcript_118966/g.319239  ORF Transcript_118966/g.319239 Transcript_118966/m.319239 type:complete len:298 (+) Transcript_118966:109-1002(+)
MFADACTSRFKGARRRFAHAVFVGSVALLHMHQHSFKWVYLTDRVRECAVTLPPCLIARLGPGHTGIRSKTKTAEVESRADFPLLHARRRIFLSASLIGIVKPSPTHGAPMGESVPGEGLVIDRTGLTSTSTRKSLNILLDRFEAQTGIKVRVICPPPGSRQVREQWREFMRPLAKQLRIDSNSVVVIAEQQTQTLSGKALGFLTINIGNKLQERFQYKFNNDFVRAVSNRFGDPSYVNAQGTDVALRDATENIVAALYELTDRESNKKNRDLFTKPFWRSYVPADDVLAILERHRV